MADKKDVVVVDKDDESQLPAYLQNNSYDDSEDNFDSSDVVLPRIKLLQGLSGEVETFNEAKAGIFWHTGLDIPLGSSIRFIVGDRRKKYLLQAPLADGQGILARADDAKTWDRLGSWRVQLKGKKKGDTVEWTIDDPDVEKSGLAKWGSSDPDNDDSAPAATQFYDYLVELEDRPDLGPAVISLARSAIKKAKKGLNDKIAIQRQNGRPMQSIVFSAEAVEEMGEEGPFKNWLFKQAGFNRDEERFHRLRELVGALANTAIKDEGDTGEQDISGGGDTGEGDF